MMVMAGKTVPSIFLSSDIRKKLFLNPERFSSKDATDCSGSCMLTSVIVWKHVEP